MGRIVKSPRDSKCRAHRARADRPEKLTSAARAPRLRGGP